MHTVRQVLPQEYHKYNTHLKNLAESSRYLRFGYNINDSAIDTLCSNIEKDKDRHILFCIENDNLEFVAVGHIALGNDMELAFSVLDSCQGQGMGNALMRRCIQWCRTHNILHGCMVCLSSNSAIRHLCSKYGMQMRNDHGETLTEFDLENAKLDTWIAETTDSNLAILDWVTKRTKNLLKTTMNLV